MWKFDLEYMTPGEIQAFKSLVNAGKMSFFSTGFCKICKCDIPRFKKYCSLACWNKNGENNPKEEEEENEEDNWEW